MYVCGRKKGVQKISDGFQMSNFNLFSNHGEKVNNEFLLILTFLQGQIFFCYGEEMNCKSVSKFQNVKFQRFLQPLIRVVQ